MTAAKTPLQPRTNATLWLLLGVAGALGTWQLYTAPQLQGLRQIRLSTAALAADKQAYELRLAEVAALDRRLVAQQPVLDQLALAVPDKPAVDELLVSLGAMASSSGIVLGTVQPSEQGTEEGITVSLTARGSYAGIRLFLEALDSNLRPIKVTELGLAAASNVDGASLVNATVQLVAATAPTSTDPLRPRSEASESQGGPAEGPGGSNE